MKWETFRISVKKVIKERELSIDELIIYMIGKLYSLKYTDIPKVFFMQHYM